MKLLLQCIILFLSVSSFAQTPQLELKGKLYYFEGKTYTCKELNELYHTHGPSLNLYLDGRKRVRVARNMAYTGLGLMATGVVTGAAIGDVEGAVVGVLFVVGGLTLELISLAPRAIGNDRIRKARREFNYEMIRRHGYQEDPSLSFGMTGNGVGFVISF